MANASHTESATEFVAFRAKGDFRFSLPNASAAAMQKGKAATVYLTNVSQFIQGVLHNNRAVELATQPVRVPCLPIEQWPQTDFRGKRLLVLLGGQALGDCVQATMALQALRDVKRPKSISVACAGPAYDIFATNRALDVSPLWFGLDDATKRFDYVIDLGHLSGAWKIDVWPVDFEGELLSALNLPPSERYPAKARALPKGRRLRIGLLPLASSPLRTLPVTTVRSLAQSLAAEGDLTICLNTGQEQGRLMKAALKADATTARIVDSFPSVAKLLQAVQRFDYAVFADSGPAHMAKLYATPGVAVYTSAPSKVLQGRFENLASYDTAFAGDHCKAPCGLAKVRQAEDGQIGCMGSLGVTLDQLPNVPRRSDPAALRNLVENPVPCVKALAEQTDDLIAFIRQDLAGRA